MSGWGVHLPIAITPLVVVVIATLLLPSLVLPLIVDDTTSLLVAMLMLMIYIFAGSFSLGFIPGSIIPDILEPYSLEKKMHRGKHHGWGRLNWLTRTCKKLFKIFLIVTGVGLVFILALVGLSFLITIPPEVGRDIGTLASLWFVGCGLVLGFLTGYLIHLKLDSSHPLGLPD